MSLTTSYEPKSFRYVVTLAFLVTNFFAIPGIFYPTAAIEKLGASSPSEGVWAAFGFLLSFLVSLFSIPVLIDVERYRFNAVVGIVSHFALFVFWFVLYPYQSAELVPWIAWYELLIAVLQAYLLSGVLRQRLENL